MVYIESPCEETLAKWRAKAFEDFDRRKRKCQNLLGDIATTSQECFDNSGGKNTFPTRSPKSVPVGCRHNAASRGYTASAVRRAVICQSQAPSTCSAGCQDACCGCCWRRHSTRLCESERTAASSWISGAHLRVGQGDAAASPRVANHQIDGTRSASAPSRRLGRVDQAIIDLRRPVPAPGEAGGLRLACERPRVGDRRCENEGPMRSRASDAASKGSKLGLHCTSAQKIRPASTSKNCFRFRDACSNLQVGHDQIETRDRGPSPIRKSDSSENELGRRRCRGKHEVGATVNSNSKRLAHVASVRGHHSCGTHGSPRAEAVSVTEPESEIDKRNAGTDHGKDQDGLVAGPGPVSPSRTDFTEANAALDILRSSDLAGCASRFDSPLPSASSLAIARLADARDSLRLLADAAKRAKVQCHQCAPLAESLCAEVARDLGRLEAAQFGIFEREGGRVIDAPGARNSPEPVSDSESFLAKKIAELRNGASEAVSLIEEALCANASVVAEPSENVSAVSDLYVEMYVPGGPTGFVDCPGAIPGGPTGVVDCPGAKDNSSVRPGEPLTWAALATQIVPPSSTRQQHSQLPPPSPDIQPKRQAIAVAVAVPETGHWPAVMPLPALGGENSATCGAGSDPISFPLVSKQGLEALVGNMRRAITEIHNLRRDGGIAAGGF